MVRAISVFLQVALAATVVNGQLGEFFKNTFGGHVPLVALAGAVPDALVAKNVVEITYENWRRSINVTVDPTASEDAAQEWLFYFTKTPVEDAPQTVGPNNITYWDSVFNDTVFALLTAKPAPKISYGKVDCLVPTAKELCYTFFLTANFRVPEFYHIVTYIHNGTTELRQIPPMLYRNVTEASQSHQKVVKYVLGKEWKGVAPWTGFLNPITGYLRSFTHIFGLLIEYYEMCPQWAIMIGISLLGRAITSRLTGRTTPFGIPTQPRSGLDTAPVPAPPAAAAAAPRARAPAGRVPVRAPATRRQG